MKVLTDPAEQDLLDRCTQSVPERTLHELYDEATAEKAIARPRRCVNLGEAITSIEQFSLDGAERRY